MLKIGIVGAGSIGARHIEAISQNPDCCLAGVADIIEERAREFAQTNETNWYTSYEALYQKEKPDAVIVNLPHGLHCTLAQYFLSKNVNVLMEKPMAISLSECDCMIQAEQKSKAKLAIGHVQRYFAAHRHVHDMVLRETYGKLCMIAETRNTDYFTKTRPRWFFDKKLAGGGIMMNLGAHSIDKLLYIVGGEVEQVSSIITNKKESEKIEGQVQLLLKLRDSISATVTLNGYSQNFYEQYFYFEQATVKVINTRRLFINTGEGFEEVPILELDVFGQQLKEFVAYVKGNESEIVTAQYARKIIAVIEAVYKQNGLEE